MSCPVLVAVQRGQALSLEQIDLRTRRAVAHWKLEGAPASDALPALEGWLRHLAAAVRSGEVRVGVDEPVTMDGDGVESAATRYLTYVCEALQGPGGEIVGAVTFAMDVTETVRAREKEQGDRPWFEAALDAIGTPVVLADAETLRIVFANASARALCLPDLTPGSVLGHAIGLDAGYFLTDAAGQRLRYDDLPAVRAARGETVDAMEILLHTPSGVTWFVCFAEKVGATHALPSVVVLSFFDISALRRAEMALVEVTAAREDFLRLAGHELRTPLTALKLQAQALRKQNAESAGLATIERAIQRMDRLVEEMLTSTRILESRLPARPEDLDLCAVVDDVIAWHDVDAKRSGASVTRVGARELRGRWDRVLLEEAINNLVRNAIRFGEGKPVRVECADLGDGVSIAVIDAGVGIDPADHERIFERFVRAVSSTHYGGLGLGLWVTREMVSRMGGSIGVQSAVGRGSTFTMVLPRTT